MLEFNDEKHEYLLDGKKLISVTELLKKHGLAPDYSSVSLDVLTAYAERGTLIHKEIEDYIKEKKTGFTEELYNFASYLDKNPFKDIKSEIRVYNDVVAGTADLILDNEIIADIKTTSVIHNRAVSWQLSIYAYLSGLDIKKGQVFHFNKDGSLEVVDIPLKSKEDVEMLIQCERDGVIYEPIVPVEMTTDLVQLSNLELALKQLDLKKKEIELQVDTIKQALLKGFEDTGIESIQNENIKITYVRPTTKSVVDITAMKEAFPNIVKEYTKKVDVKSSLRIKFKGGN